MAPSQGFEPQMTASEAAVLPVTPTRNGAQYPSRTDVSRVATWCLGHSANCACKAEVERIERYALAGTLGLATQAEDQLRFSLPLGGEDQGRTGNRLIANQMLYHWSYLPINPASPTLLLLFTPKGWEDSP